MTALSEYYNGLEASVKTRYLQKISHIRGDDPYTLKKTDFCENVASLPDLRSVTVTLMYIGSQTNGYFSFQ